MELHLNNKTTTKVGNNRLSESRLPYLSPTSINQYHVSIEEFFLRYIVRVPRQPQTQPMAVGSAFDACVKAYLMSWSESYDKDRHKEYYAKNFEDMVEDHNKEWAASKGIIVFNMYKETGALDHITRDVEPGTLRPLDKVEKVINGIPFLGKPDLTWISKLHGCSIVDDWKCNGACSPHNKSPTPGYMDMFPSRGMHKHCMLVDGVNTLDIHQDYETQLVLYSFLTDAEIVGISQLVFGASAPGVFGNLRVALHRHRISEKLKIKVMDMALTVWDSVCNYEDGGPFGTISSERCALLIKQGKLLEDPIERMLAGRG